MAEKQLLVLIGSPRMGSTSAHLALPFIDGLTARGWITRSLRITAALRTPKAWTELESAYRAADVVLIASPLYVDALPAPVIRALERLAAMADPPAPGLLAIINSGFIEAHQNDVALAILEEFARETGARWLGGFALGGGGALGGQSLMKMGGMTAHLLRAFEMTVAALADGTPIPEEAQTLVRRRLMSRWLYCTIANLGMLKAAMDHGALWRIHARPYKR